MPPVRSFRTSLYLSLAVAITSLGVASGDLLPEIPFITAFSLLLLGCAYALEGRWQLSLRDANLVGLFLAALLGLWGIFQAIRPPTHLTDTLPWPASALPYLAPVLMILIPAKLLRPKHIGDYWAMHGLGLLAMALACAMASDGLFIVVFAVYAAAFVWSLDAFHLYRELGPSQAAAARLGGGRFRGSRTALRWAVLTGAVAVPLFWATPRSSSQWELGINTRGRMSTGITTDGPDLNTTGAVAINREKAFEFYAEDQAGNPVADLPADLRFRTSHLQNYQAGRWGRNQFGSVYPADRTVTPPGVNSEPRQRLPDFGPQTVYLRFQLDPKLSRAPPLADPVAWRPQDRVPAVSRFEDARTREVVYKSWMHRHDGSIDGVLSLDTIRPEYNQAWVPPPGPGYGPVMRVYDPKASYLITPPRGLPRLKGFTDDLIHRLIAERALSADILARRDQREVREWDPADHEDIAHALARHLAGSGEYAYTLDLTRQDRGIDPTEDFLFNTKAGHCQRFATALVLMLRTQAVPSQMVLGYLGCESRGDGWYDVREDQAHAWVEILVPASADGLPPVAVPRAPVPLGGMPPIGPGARAPIAPEPMPPAQPMRWITVDPTPGGDLADAAQPSLFGQARQQWEALLKAFLLAYNKQSREQAVASAEEWLTHRNGAIYLIAGAAGLVGLWWLRRALRRRSSPRPMFPDYVRRLSAILARAGHAWPTGQTAREYVSLAAAALKKAAGTTAVADVPGRVVSAYYAERFGERPLSADDRRGLDADLRRLAAALA